MFLQQHSSPRAAWRDVTVTSESKEGRSLCLCLSHQSFVTGSTFERRIGSKQRACWVKFCPVHESRAEISVFHSIQTLLSEVLETVSPRVWSLNLWARPCGSVLGVTVSLRLKLQASQNHEVCLSTWRVSMVTTSINRRSPVLQTTKQQLPVTLWLGSMMRLLLSQKFSWNVFFPASSPVGVSRSSGESVHWPGACLTQTDLRSPLRSCFPLLLLLSSAATSRCSWQRATFGFLCHMEQINPEISLSGSKETELWANSILRLRGPIIHLINQLELKNCSPNPNSRQTERPL